MKNNLEFDDILSLCGEKGLTWYKGELEFFLRQPYPGKPIYFVYHNGKRHGVIFSQTLSTCTKWCASQDIIKGVLTYYSAKNAFNAITN